MKVALKQKKKSFTMVSNKIAQDSQLSLKAKGIALLIAHFPDDWHFYEEKLQDYTTDRRTAIANAIIELEMAEYLLRKQLRKKGRFANKIWIFNDEGLTEDDINELCPECRKTDVDKNDNEKSTTTNTHSTNTNVINKKISQKKGRKRKYYDYVNLLKKQAMEYPDLTIIFEDKYYDFIEKNGKLLLRDKHSKIILSKVHAENLYSKMCDSVDTIIKRF